MAALILFDIINKINLCLYLFIFVTGKLVRLLIRVFYKMLYVQIMLSSNLYQSELNQSLLQWKQVMLQVNLQFKPNSQQFKHSFLDKLCQQPLYRLYQKQMPYQKSIQEYRRDIFSLKSKLKEQEKYLEEIKQKYSDVDVFGQQKSYSFSLKLKILEYNLNGIRQNMDKYKKREEYDIYALNFATLALMKACQVFMLSKEMVWRAVDIKNQNKIKGSDLWTFMKDTLRMSEDLIRPIIEVISDKQAKNGIIKKQRYMKYIQSFLLDSEQQLGKQSTTIQDSCIAIAKQIIIHNNTNPNKVINPQLIWTPKQINIAVFCQGLMRKLPTFDILDCVAMYCKLDPTKKGYLETKDVVTFLINRINDVKNLGLGDIKLRK